MLDAAFQYTARHPETTVLYQVVAEQLETFLSRQQERDRPVPRFVEKEFRSFLDCGILARGFLRLHCQSCGHDRLLPFSCKGRVWCPSCGGRRMADTAAHLVDRVFPIVPVRQWVLSLPFALRYRVAYDARLMGAVLNVFNSRPLWRIEEACSRTPWSSLFAVWRRDVCAAPRRCPQCQCSFPLFGDRRGLRSRRRWPS